MTLNVEDFDSTFWLASDFTTEQATALAEFAAAVIDDMNEYRSAAYVSGTAKYLKWNADAASYPAVVYP